MSNSQIRWIVTAVALVLLLTVAQTARTIASPTVQQSDVTATPAGTSDSGTIPDDTEPDDTEPGDTDDSAEALSAAGDGPSTFDQFMYLRSQPLDADSCAMTVVEGRLAIDPTITNPAMTCPDMFAWKLFVESIQDEYWSNWSVDGYTFPSEPLPLCQADATDRSNCCTPGSLTNPGYDDPTNPATHCPYFPGDHLDDDTGPVPSNTQAVAQISHFDILAAEGVSDEALIARQEAAEIVFRNRDMFDYIYENNIYHQDGLAEVFARATNGLENRAPAHVRNAPGELVRIDFPVPSNMIKTNWISKERAEALGITNDPENPFITMEIQSPTVDNFGNIQDPGIHYLTAIHISTKDTPNWVWTTFEHVNNPGRCDMTGCNDSYGYTTPDAVDADQYANYIAPNQRSNDLVISSIVADLGKIYSGDSRTPELAAIFQALDIGTAESAADTTTPSITDPAWGSYRLKGSQVNFTDPLGLPTLVGNSLIEAGFVNTSSCMTCHARAAFNEEGQITLSLFINELSKDGYPQGPNGAPVPEWFYDIEQGGGAIAAPRIKALPGDFVWGFVHAQPLQSADE